MKKEAESIQEKTRGKGKAPPPPPPLPSPSTRSKTDLTTSQSESLVNGQQKSNGNISESVKKVPLPIRPKLNHSKSMEEITNTSVTAKTPPNTPNDHNALNLTDNKPVLPAISANAKSKNNIQNERITPERETDERKLPNSTDIIVCSGTAFYSLLFFYGLKIF